MKWLKENAPAPLDTARTITSGINGQFGLKRLVEHIWMVIGMATACRDMTELRQRMAERFGREKVQFNFDLPPIGPGYR